MVRRHNARVIVLILIYLAAVYLIFHVTAPHSNQCLMYAICLFVPMVVAIFLWIPRSDASDCRRIGFICPRCGKPLYYQSSMFAPWSRLITRGECPHCGMILTDAVVDA
jgi:hypothetical protein